MYLKRPVYLISLKDIADFISWFADAPSSSSLDDEEETDDRQRNRYQEGIKKEYTQTNEIERKKKIEF